MSVVEKLNAVKNIIPPYWPIGIFASRNPLLGFEHMKFKDGLKKAKELFGAKVYMDPDYFIERYRNGTIDEAMLEDNLRYLLQAQQKESFFDEAKRFLLEVSPKWQSFKSYEALEEARIDPLLRQHIKQKTCYDTLDRWIEVLTRHMTLYEIHDALFETSKKELIEKDIIEFLARFLDQQQTTLSMSDRDRGLFGAFKLYEDIDYLINAEEYVQEAIEQLKVDEVEDYFLTHLLKLYGWAGFLRYRSEDESYEPQRMHPSSMIDYLAVRLHYELKFMKDEKINDFQKLNEFISENKHFTILKLLQARGKLTGKYNDALEQSKDYESILKDYANEEIDLLTLQAQTAYEALGSDTIRLSEFSDFADMLKEEEGYVWLKSLEDSYIRRHVKEFLSAPSEKKDPECAMVFCLDVRSESIRRNIEATGDYETYGVGGFLGIPISLIPFDKAHEVSQAPAFVTPENLVFEIPTEAHDEYNRKKQFSKTVKKVLNDLKNNPYTPYIMVESIGWLFGVKLFGKTFAPKKTKEFFDGFVPEKPNTTYTIDRLDPDAIESFAKKVHINTIKEVLTTQTDLQLSDDEIDELWNFLVFGRKLHVKVPVSVLDRLRFAYRITKEDFEVLKEKFEHVGFTYEEQATFVENALKTIGLYKDFPSFVVICAHGSCSDNNPFEASLDCGACGGNISLPNARIVCQMANNPKVRAVLKERGVDIPETTRFIPAIHNTTDDEITFKDTHLLSDEEQKKITAMRHDLKRASALSRAERMQALPNATSQESILMRTMDWSEPRPEWGLVRNMGAFAGPRSSCAHMKMDNRIFLHSYDADADTEDAKYLTLIFNGPLIVGEWINLEYYFSTVDNNVFGAGSKVYHNIVSKVGVYYGNYSDLKIGLPTQSVWLEGKPYHEPVRLLTYMEAPLEKVGKAVENSIAKEFILNEWIRPVIIDKAAKKVYSYEHGEFRVIHEIE